MKRGTPGFVSARLRQGREARGISAISLSELVGVSRQAVSQYETGAGAPTPEVLQRIAGSLNLPVAFFLHPVPVGRPESTFFRSQSAATKAARARALRRQEWIQEIVLYLKRFVRLPDVAVPSLALPTDPRRMLGDDIESAAAAVRRRWDLGEGPISNVVWLIENHGVVVTRSELDADKLDALSGWLPEIETPCVYLNADKNTGPRSRFDAAHELGHLVLHKGLGKEALSQPDFSLMERQAHRFAGAFLLPARAFAADLKSVTLDGFWELKLRWKGSIAMMVHRSQDLGLVNDHQAQRLWINYTQRGWRRHEPFDEELPPEAPRLLARSFQLLVQSGRQTRSDIVDALALPARDIEELAGLPARFFDEPTHNGPEIRRSTVAPERGVGGQPIPFRRRRSDVMDDTL